MQFLKWVLEIFLITTFFTFTSTSQKETQSKPTCSKIDRDALLGFKARILKDTTGILSTWSGSDCCGGGWQGVECSAGRVTKLIIQRPSSSPSLFMKGTLSHSLSNLQFLEVMMITGMKHISGTIIPHNLTHLTHLALEDNSLHGKIPSTLGLLRHLQTLSLSGNHLIGQIPPSLGNLRNLLQLNLARNSLTGPIPTNFHALRKLQFLDLGFNKLSKKIPDFLWGILNLTYLVLTSNKFSGEIPISLFNLTNLSTLSLDQNLLIGRIPTQIGGLTSVSVMKLSSNKLTGRIPDSIAELHSLWNLNLSRNMLTNPLPNIGEGLPSLLSIDLSYNDLDLRAIPDWIMRRELYDLHLAGCKMRGKLPNLTRTKFLTTLDLSHNYFTNGISSFLMNMTSLESVKISNNLLTSSLSSIKFPNYITFLDLHSNQLHGSLPNMLSKSMEVVDVSSNEISGNMPEFIRDSKLRVLNIARNRISGRIPGSVSNLAMLERLDVSRNRIGGRIPTGVGSLKKLQWLDVSMNKLSGKIPESLLRIEALKHASFRANRLCGKIPQGRPYNVFPVAAYAHNLCLCDKPLLPCDSKHYTNISL